MRFLEINHLSILPVTILIEMSVNNTANLFCTRNTFEKIFE